MTKKTTELTDIDAILDEYLGKPGTPERRAAIRQSKVELRMDLRHYACRGERVTLSDILRLK